MSAPGFEIASASTEGHLNSTCILRYKKKNFKEPDVFIKEDFDFGRALELQPDISEYVFEYLDFNSLQMVQSINNTWKRLAERELNRRNTSSWIVCSNSPPLRSIRVSPNFGLNNMALGIIGYAPSSIKLQKYVCVHNRGEFQRMPFVEYLNKEIAPENVTYCAIGFTGISTPNNTQTDHFPLYMGVFIPVIPNIRIVPFYYNAKKDSRISYFKSNEQIKCLLVFTRKFRVSHVEKLFATLLEGHVFCTMAMGGGLVKTTKVFPMIKSLIRFEDMFCIAFVQERGQSSDFNAYSVLTQFEERSRNEEEYNLYFKNELLRLKRIIVQRESGIIFRFCCYAKEYKSQENRLLERYFPGYVIFGIDVDGEIGWDSSFSLRDEDAAFTPPKTFRLAVPETLHGWSSVLVFITWGKLTSYY